MTPEQFDGTIEYIDLGIEDDKANIRVFANIKKREIRVEVNTAKILGTLSASENILDFTNKKLVEKLKEFIEGLAIREHERNEHLERITDMLKKEQSQKEKIENKKEEK